MAVAVDTATPHTRIGGAARAAVTTISAAIVIALLSVINAIAFAGLICSGPLAPGLLVGISAILSGLAVSAIVIALLSAEPGMATAPISASVVVYALIAAAVARAMPSLDPVRTAQAAMLVSGAVTAFAGIVFVLIGVFRLGALARFLPYPVVSAYNAGIGWVFVLGGLKIATTLDPHGSGWFDLLDPVVLPRAGAAIAMTVMLLVVERALRHWAAIPLALVTGFVAFHAIRLLVGADLPDLGSEGWLLGPFAPGRIWSAPDWTLATQVPWTRVTGLGSLVLTVVLLGAMTVILVVSGLELELRKPLQLNREVFAAGIGSIAAAPFGGLVSTQSVISTTMARRMGARTRATALGVALCCALVVLAGAGTLNVVPRFLVGAVLLSNGCNQLIRRVWDERHRLPRQEMAALLMVLLAIIWLGFVPGVGVGLILTLLMFVWNYRSIPVVRMAASGAIQRSSLIRPREAEAVLETLGASVRLCRLQGYLFFLNAVDLLKEVPERGLRYLILDFRGVVGIDTSACMIFRRLHQLAQERGFALMLTGLSRAIGGQLRRQEIATTWPPGLAACDTADKALSYAEDDLLAAEAAVASKSESASFAALITDVTGRRFDDARLAGYLDRLDIEAGAILMRQDDPADALYFIVAGTVSIHIELPGGRREHLRTAQAGTIMGELGIYAGRRSTATVLADTSCLVDRLSVREMERMERDDPDLATRIHRTMTALIAEKLAGSNRFIEQLMR
ncbi:MAG: SulP family inorganic anion transporter [Acetobacteraceae bacterium]